MEVYNFYRIAFTSIYMFKGEAGIETCVLWGLPIGIVLWIALFFLQGAGIYAMAKRRGMKKKGLAFVPFANLYYLGKIAGECGIFGHRMRNAGLYTMIAQILATVVTGLYLGSEWFLYLKHGVPTYVESNALLASPQWTGLTGFSETVYKTFLITEWLFSLLSLIAQILLIILCIGVYKCYTPRNYQGLALLTFFIPMARYIVIFALRNKQYINFDEYMRKQREAYMRRRQQYYNGYGNPYGSFQGGYGRGGYQGGNGGAYGGYNDPYAGGRNTQSSPAEEPFGEFGGSDRVENCGDDTQSEGADGLFD